MNKKIEEAFAGIPISFDLVEGAKVMHNVELVKSALERSEIVEIENTELKSRNEKLEKAWKIIKERNPRLSLIKSMIKTNSVDSYDYNCNVFSYERLTETDFNDLVRILEEK